MSRSSHPAVAALLLVPLLASCRTGPPPPNAANQPRALPPPLPDTTGFGTHVLAIRRAPGGAVWVGTFGRGIQVLDPGARAWRSIEAADREGAISWDFVNAFAFPGDGSVWYGTVGNGFGRSADGGRTWRNWGFGDLGPEWQYVAPEGMDAYGDTVFIATADGLRMSWDAGATWRCVQAEGAPPGGAEGYDDLCSQRILALPTEYLLALDAGPDGTIWLGHLKGVSFSRDGGLTWRTPEGPAGLAGARVRALLAERDAVWAATEDAFFEAEPERAIFERIPDAVFGGAGVPEIRSMLMGRTVGGARFPALATHGGSYEPMLTGGELFLRHYGAGDSYALLDWPGGQPAIAGTDRGITASLAGRPLLGPIDRGSGCLSPRDGEPPPDCGTARAKEPSAPRHAWFGRPIADEDGNPYIDATYRYGSTMGGNFQQHQGVEFNNPAGTPVRAIGDGVVAFSGRAEAGANTVAILHDRRWETRPVYSVYYHNSSLAVAAGERVRRGQVIARVGNTGRATNDHLHLEVHVPEIEDSALVVNPAERFPPHTANPQLWIEPLPGTGIVAGRVFGPDGEPVRGLRVYGITTAYPEETPLSFVETYGDRAHADPAYGEHFAIGDVPAGTYRLSATAGGRRAAGVVEVEAGLATWVELRF